MVYFQWMGVILCNHRVIDMSLLWDLRLLLSSFPGEIWLLRCWDRDILESVCVRWASAAGKSENLISRKHKCIFFYRKLDQNTLTHIIHPPPGVCIDSGTLPSPVSSLVLCVGETAEENIKISWGEKATGSPRTWALCPVGPRPQQHCHCPSQKGWNVDEGQLDPTATLQTKGLQMGQEEA